MQPEREEEWFCAMSSRVTTAAFVVLGIQSLCEKRHPLAVSVEVARKITTFIAAEQTKEKEIQSMSTVVSTVKSSSASCLFRTQPETCRDGPPSSLT